MSLTEILIGLIIGLIITYSIHDRWCGWVKAVRDKKEGETK